MEQSFGKKLLNYFFSTFIKTSTILVVLFLAIAGLVFKAQKNAEVKKNDDFFAQDYEYKYLDGDSYATDSILFIPINGVIMGNKPNGMGLNSIFSQNLVTYGSEIAKMINDSSFDDQIHGIVLEINSPGGTVFGAKMISDAIEKYQKNTKKKVFAHIVGMGTSAAYRISASCDKIYAEEGTEIGSVGVIAGPFKKYDEVVSESINSPLGSTSISAYGKSKYEVKGGIHTYFITAGKYKDMGNPYRRMSKEEKTNIQRNIDEIYKLFVKHVINHREIKEKDLKEKYGAFSFVPSRAKSKKYIDGIANRDKVVENIKKESDLTGSLMLIQAVPTVPKLNPLLSLLGYGAKTSVQTPFADMQNKICGNNVNMLAYHGNIENLCR